ncbi:MAG: sulfotransferase, partial [Chloroflexota bacterium]|nr:sulfotransferase [Chloroflexota bacterium]
SILVAGAARSGTTWLGDLIASQIPCRILFEPFNPNLVPEYRGFRYFQYMRPGSEDPEFRAFARMVFTGEIRNRWVDRQNERIVSEYRLIKEIRANLALKWLHDNFPEIPIIFLMRHPCAVVSSRMELGWATDSDIQPFLSQPDLMGDYLCDYHELIRNAKTEEEKHAIIWSISNLVPLKQFQPGELKIVYYEHLCTQPDLELPEIFNSIGQRYDATAMDRINRPSQTTRKTSAVVNGKDQIFHWKQQLTPLQIDNILRVVEKFGLDDLYKDSFLPVGKDAA